MGTHTLRSWWHSRSLESRDPNTRLHTIERLAKSIGTDAATLLLEALYDAEPAVRAAAASALGKRRESAAVQPLVCLLLRERDASVFHAASGALAAFALKEAVPMLVGALDDPDAGVRQVSASVLRRIGWNVLDGTQQARIAIVLDDWGLVVTLGPDAVESVCRVLLRGTPHLQREAAEALGRIGDKVALAGLLYVLHETRASAGARKMAAWALRRFVWPNVGDADMQLAASLVC